MRLRHEALGKIGKRLADAPYARRIRVDVVKHAQEPLAVQRVRRKGIDMQARIVLAPAHGAAGNLRRAQRRARPLQVRAVVRKQREDEALRGIGIAADQRCEIGQVCRFAHRAAHGGLVGAHVDVLGFAVRPARVEKALLARIERKIQIGKMQHVAALERSAHGNGFIGRDMGRPFPHRPGHHRVDGRRLGGRCLGGMAMLYRRVRRHQTLLRASHD